MLVAALDALGRPSVWQALARRSRYMYQDSEVVQSGNVELYRLDKEAIVRR